jgi:hypothetical protein
MADFTNTDLSGSVFREVDLRGARFANVDLRGAVIRGAWLEDVEVDALVRNLVINGVDVGPLIEAELDRQDPDRVKMRPVDAAGFREGWAVIERRWATTVERALRLPRDLLHVRVDGEYSFVETLRHLVFATDAWVSRAVLGEPAPYSPLGLPHDEMPDIPGVPRDREARPPVEEVLALRADRFAVVRRVLADLTDDQLDGSTEPVPGPGYPESASYPVRRCLGAILNEEWLHRLYAERDLDVLESRAPAGP